MRLWRKKDMAKNCNECGTKNQDLGVNVPYVVHESAMARAERNIKRLWIAIIASIVLLFASNAFWLWAWMQYDYESYEAITDSGGDANIIGNDGDIYNGYGEVKTEN
jgi:hypothetical protein